MNESSIAREVGVLLTSILRTGESSFLYTFEVHEDFHRLLVAVGSEVLAADLPTASHEDWLDAHAFFLHVCRDADLMPEFRLFLPTPPRPFA